MVIITTANTRWSAPAAWNPPNRRDKPDAHDAALKSKRQPRRRKPEKAGHQREVEAAIERVEPSHVPALRLVSH